MSAFTNPIDEGRGKLTPDNAGEVRVTDPDTGADPEDGGRGETAGYKRDVGKLRYDLIPEHALEQLASVYTKGAAKYSDYNWRRGMRWSRVYAAAMRHLIAYRRGEWADAESGEAHLAHVLWNVITLMEYQRLAIGVDDRTARADLSPEYMASLLDGEGTLTISRQERNGARGVRVRWVAIVAVSSTDFGLLSDLQRTYGGNVQNRGVRQGGVVRGNRPCGVWTANRSDLAGWLCDVVPLMRTKRRQGELMLEFLSTYPLDRSTKRVAEEVRKNRDRLTRAIQAANNTGKDDRP